VTIPIFISAVSSSLPEKPVRRKSDNTGLRRYSARATVPKHWIFNNLAERFPPRKRRSSKTDLATATSTLRVSGFGELEDLPHRKDHFAL
jgi:hypothetical protein